MKLDQSKLWQLFHDGLRAIAKRAQQQQRVQTALKEALAADHISTWQLACVCKMAIFEACKAAAEFELL